MTSFVRKLYMIKFSVRWSRTACCSLQGCYMRSPFLGLAVREFTMIGDGLQELECQQDTEQGWPKLVLMVDEVQHALGCSGGGRATTLAYAVIPLPCSQGLHKIDAPCMRVFHRRSPRDVPGEGE